MVLLVKLLYKIEIQLLFILLNFSYLLVFIYIINKVI